ncbi:hypothetical protein TNCV_4750051 [Trichonephila clavipes]|nr:hypothetical protein TNCV_4750051 [Trichonephila clavipes]
MRFSNLVHSSFYYFFIIQTQTESLPEPNEIGILIEEVVDLARQINSEVDGEKLLDFCNQELTTDELIEMHEQEQDIEELASIDLVQSEGRMMLVYADKPQTLDHLEDNIRRVIADIWPQMLEKVIENWTSRLDYIQASRGSLMPEIIFKM